MRLPFHEPSRTFLLLWWIPAQFVICAACLALSARSYPHYSLFDHDISFLGHPRLNSAGWLFWSAGMGLSGLMLWPVAVHMSGRMRALTAGQFAGQFAGRCRVVAAGTFASRCACVGLVGLALIPQFPDLDPAHELAGVLAMGGMYVALWSFAGVLICGAPISVAKTLLFVLGVGWGPVGFLLTQSWRFFVYGELGHDGHASPRYLLLRFSLWEWLLFICLFPALLLVVLRLPDPPSEPKAADPSTDSQDAAEAAI
ncbi:MAG TPA: hypothetical protein VHY91_26970 [Pirellulales bacterium]|jgi:hypothetical protein|nr:hypothetical protein [Pirellulales bacterium]